MGRSNQVESSTIRVAQARGKTVEQINAAIYFEYCSKDEIAAISDSGSPEQQLTHAKLMGFKIDAFNDYCDGEHVQFFVVIGSTYPGSPWSPNFE